MENPIDGGEKYTGGGKNWQFSTDIAVYLGDFDGLRYFRSEN